MGKRGGEEHWGLLKGQWKWGTTFPRFEAGSFDFCGIDQMSEVVCSIDIWLCTPCACAVCWKRRKKNPNVKWIPKNYEQQQQKSINQGTWRKSRRKRHFFFLFTLSLASLFSLQSLPLSSQLFFVSLNDFSIQYTMAKVSRGQGAKLHILYL